jgi:glycosyltransferase involved in cell wall biosynthesis
MYDAERYIAQTITSCINQTYKNWELIIVDDCSNDQSMEIVEQFNDHRIQILQMPTNSGPAAARNYGLQFLKGDWITVLDADDAFREDRLDSLLKIVDLYGDESIVFEKLISWKGASLIPGDFLAAKNPSDKKKSRQVSINYWIEKAGYSKPFFNSNLLSSGVRYPEDIRGVEDTVFFIKLCLHNSVKIIEAETQSYVYRHVSQSLSNRGALQLDEVAKAVALLRRSENLPEAIQRSISLIEKKNQANALAQKVKFHFSSHQYIEMTSLLFIHRYLVRLLFVRTVQSIWFRAKFNHLHRK